MCRVCDPGTITRQEDVGHGHGRQVKHVLVVEDDEVIAELVASILSESGFAVERASTAEDAMTRVRHDPPALVLLDLTLPGMSGTAFLNRCKRGRATPDIPVVVMSGTVSRLLPAPARADAVLTKPFDIDQLCDTVNRLADQC
jgi:CheY-like chemotaxis protein